MDLKRISRNLEKEVCSVHREHLTATTKDGKTSLTNYCCEDFRIKVSKKMKSEIDKQAMSDIKNIFKK